MLLIAQWSWRLLKPISIVLFIRIRSSVLALLQPLYLPLCSMETAREVRALKDDFNSESCLEVPAPFVVMVYIYNILEKQIQCL